MEWGEFLGRPKPVDEVTVWDGLTAGLEPIIQLRSLNIGYGKSLAKDITAEIYTGDRIAIIGPSGVGKDTIIIELRKIFPDFHFVITSVTRPPRKDETEGINHFFVSEPKFLSNFAIFQGWGQGPWLEPH